MNPTDVINILRLANTGEVREILESFEKKYPGCYSHLVFLISRFDFKRKSNNLALGNPERKDEQLTETLKQINK